MGDTAGMSASQASQLQEGAMATSAMSSIAGTVENIGAIKAQGAYSSSIANANAAMAGLKAKQTLQAGDVSASRKEMQTEQQVGAIKAQQGASGVDVGSGSSAMVRSGVSTVGQIDEATIRNNAAREAWGYQTQATMDTYQGQFDQLTAKSKTFQTAVTGGLSAISGPMAMYSQSALWQYRYGGRGNPGVPYPSGGGGSNTTDSNFWGEDQG